MKNTVRVLGVGLAGLGLLVSTAFSAAAAPSKFVPESRGVGTRPVGVAQTPAAAGEAIGVTVASRPVSVSVWATCVSSAELSPIGSLWIEAVNNTDTAQNLTFAVTEIDESPVGADWESLPLEPGESHGHVVEGDGERVGDGMAIRFWEASSPGDEWDAMVSLPDCANGDPFTDSKFFEDQFGMEIDWMYHSGTSTGWLEEGGTRTYRGLQSMNRDAMAVFLYRMAGEPGFTAPATPTFTDVSTSNVFYKEIEWLASTKITDGWTEPNNTKTFRPLSPVKRDAMAAFLYRFSVYQGQPTFTPEPGTYIFEDVPVGTEHFDAMYWMAVAGISSGWQVGADEWEYRPLNDVKRDAIAAFMFRYTDHVSHP